jgi:hypothetical protein
MKKSPISLQIDVPGANHCIDAEVVLKDLAKKLRGTELRNGSHEVLIFDDGSVMVDSMYAWQPRGTSVPVAAVE